MRSLDIQKRCELHVHPGGCFTAEDLVMLGRDVYQQVDWSLYCDSYEEAFGTRPDPEAMFEAVQADESGGLDRFREQFVYGEQDGGDFGRFQAKFRFLICLYRYYLETPSGCERMMECVINRHRSEGLTYVEYRGSRDSRDDEEFLLFHRVNAKTLQDASLDSFTLRYIVSLRRWAALEDYELVQRLMDESPELIPTIVGVDFCFIEEGYPPKHLRPLFERVFEDNRKRPERALGIVYHVGESYFDKSLESAVRWCHEVAEMGAERLGHATALGLDPAAAIARRANAHENELVSERVDQIDYDLEHCDSLKAYGIVVDRIALRAERKRLEGMGADEEVGRSYDEARLEEIRMRQRFVLDRLAKLGTVIESCPTSNLRIGAVPSASHHPVHQFLSSEVNLAIGADDPGIFDSPLANEVDWVLTHSGMDEDALEKRLGDPRRFRLDRNKKRITNDECRISKDPL